MSEALHRVPLRESVNRATLEDAAWSNGWLLWNEIERSDSTPHEVVWVLKDQKTSIHFVEDFVIDVDYLVIKGPDADKVLKEAVSSLDSYDKNDILELAKKAAKPEERIRAVYYAGAAGAGPFDRDLFGVIERAAEDEDAKVRRAAIVATGYLEWAQARKLLERLARDDPDDRVREDAKLMLEGLGKA